jgi:two-component system, NtrC family, response regulator AtoC
MPDGPSVFKILVVDDEDGFRSLVSWQLRRRGWDVHLAEDGEQALRQLEEQSFNLVITDLTMPRLEGLKVLTEVEQLYPATKVIIVTGFSTVETAVYAMKQGAFDFLLKPFVLDDLLHAVDRALEMAGPGPRSIPSSSP